MSLIQVTNLTFGYDGSYENIFENVSFQIDTDWRLGFTGRNGRGKTTFLNLLLGKFAYRGNISADVEFSYFPYAVADDDVTALDAVAQMYPDYEYWRVAKEMAALQLDEQVLLALSVSQRANLYIWDEPMNYIDVISRMQIEQVLLSSQPTILFVEHDRKFCEKVATKTVCL